MTQNLITHNGNSPKIGKNVFIAPNATIIGDVEIGDNASIWFGVVIRGDTGRIRIGHGTNVQDNTVVHVNVRNDTLIGNNVTIGHAAVVEGCTIEDDVLIGMNATVLDGVKIGRYSIVAAGSVVREGGEIEENSLVAGIPAKYKRSLDDRLKDRITFAAIQYQKYAQGYRHLDGAFGDSDE